MQVSSSSLFSTFSILAWKVMGHPDSAVSNNLIGYTCNCTRRGVGVNFGYLLPDLLLVRALGCWHKLLSSGSLLILPEGVVVGIQIFAWAPTNINKNLIFSFLKFFFENFRRRSVRVLKLHTGVYSHKKRRY